MSSFLALRQLLTVGDLFAASALIIGLAWQAPFRKTASTRHLAWVAGFGALLALPLLLTIVPSQFSFVLAAPVVETSRAVDVATIAAPAAVASLPQSQSFHVDPAVLLRGMIFIWLLGVGVIALRGVVAMIGLDRLRRNSVGHVFRDLPAFARGYDIRIASDECGPVTWGFVWPIILLPKSADYWPTERVTAVLLHEIAHIRRGDSLTQMLSLAVCALYWPNPFVWIGARAMRREAEIAADDAVIVSGVRPSYYAAELLHLAAQFRDQRPALLDVPMAERAALEARVEAILAQTQQRSGVSAMDILKITATGVVAVAALAFACPSLAQDAPPASAMAAPAQPAEPAAPPAPVAQAELPAPPVPPSNTAASTPHHHHVQIIDDRRAADGKEGPRITVDGRELDPNSGEYRAVSAQERAAMAQEAEAMKREDAEMVRENAEMAKEAAEMRAEDAAVRAQDAAVRAEQPRVEDVMREVRPQLQHALDEARAEIAKANIDVKTQEKIDRALSRVEARMETHEHDHDTGREVVIERTENTDDK